MEIVRSYVSLNRQCRRLSGRLESVQVNDGTVIHWDSWLIEKCPRACVESFINILSLHFHLPASLCIAWPSAVSLVKSAAALIEKSKYFSEESHLVVGHQINVPYQCADSIPGRLTNCHEVAEKT